MDVKSERAANKPRKTSSPSAVSVYYVPPSSRSGSARLLAAFKARAGLLLIGLLMGGLWMALAKGIALPAWDAAASWSGGKLFSAVGALLALALALLLLAVKLYRPASRPPHVGGPESLAKAKHSVPWTQVPRAAQRLLPPAPTIEIRELDAEPTDDFFVFHLGEAGQIKPEPG